MFKSSRLDYVQAICIALVFGANSADALSDDEWQRIDGNDTQTITPDEIGPVLARLDDLTNEELALISLVRDFGREVPLSLFLGDDAARPCGEVRRFYLRDRPVGVSASVANLHQDHGNGARFSYTTDRLTGEDSWSADGTLMWVFGHPCLSRGDRAPGSAYVSATVIAPYLQFSGSGSSSGDGPSRLVFGLAGETSISDGPIFDNQILSYAAYKETDFNGDSAIYGASFSWLPISLGARLNGYVGATDPVQFKWALQVNGDYRSVSDPGSSALTADTEYTWIGAEVGADLLFGNFGNGLEISTRYSQHVDLMSDEMAGLWTATADLFLTADRRTSLSLVYKEGTEYQTLTEVDQTTFAISLQF